MPPSRPNGKAVSKPKDTKKTIRRLMHYLGDFKPLLLIVFICVIVGTVTNLAGSYMIRPIINDIVGGGGPSALIRSLIYMALIYLAGIIAVFIQKQLMIRVSQTVLFNMRRDMFQHMQKLPVRYFDTRTNGEIMSLYSNDIDNIGNMLDNSITAILNSVISLAGTLFLMFYTNVWLTLITLVMIPIMLGTARGILKKSQNYFREQQHSLGKVNGYIEETVTGQKVVKVFNHEPVAKEEFSHLNEELRDKQIMAQFMSGVVMPVSVNMNSINYALNTVVGAYLCIAKGFDIGGLAVSINYSRQVGRPINEVSGQISTIMSALAGAERVFRAMDEELETDEADAGELSAVKGKVILKNVTFGYNPDKIILKNISLYAKPGQKIAFVGSTGAGKTTITNLLTRFYDIQEGTITIDGLDISKVKRDNLRSQISMVLQDTHLFTGTVMENIRYGRLDATDEEVIQAAKTAYAHGFIKRLPQGYDTVLEGDGANLSQGQRQLLNIARAAVSKAPILILDEATSSVDTRTERYIDKGMDQLMKNRTTFVIAHRLSTVRNANAIMVLENGEIIERGEHDELLAMKGRYYQLSTGLAELD